MDLEALGQQFGLTPQQTQAAFEALAPVVASGLRRQASGGGLSDLAGALQGGAHTRYADDPSAASSPQAVDDGNAFLGQIFGSKDMSRGVAQQLSADTGIGAAILKKMLPVIAAMIMGQLAKSAMGGTSGGGNSGGGLGDILGQILGGGQQGQAGGGGLGDILGQVLGGATQSGGGGGGLGDILGQVLGGGQQGQSGGGGLGDILGQVLGGGTTQGNAADDLLKSVSEALRRR